MQNIKQHKLNVIQPNETENTIIEDKTCFSVQSEHNVCCQRKRCQHWIAHSETQNCVIIAAQEGSHTLQKIGQIYGLTRMRICQIEKNIFEKVRKIS